MEIHEPAQVPLVGESEEVAPPVRPARRKKKSSQELSAFPPEHGEETCDKALESLKSKFIAGFDYLDRFSVNDIVCEKQLILDHLDRLQLGLCGRASYDDEVAHRYQRMVAMASAMKELYLQEKERARGMWHYGTEARHNSASTLTEMTQHFNTQMGVLRNQCMSMSRAMQALERDKTSLQKAYEDMVSRAAKAVESAEMKISRLELVIKELEEELQELKGQNLHLATQIEQAKTEGRSIGTSMNSLDKNHADPESLDSAEMAARNFELLLEIATSKLGLYEQEEGRLRSVWRHALDQERRVDSDKHWGSSKQTYGPLNTTTTQPCHAHLSHLPSDNISVTSLDTADSELSSLMRIEENGTISSSTRSLFQKPSPKLKKKRRLTLKNLLRKSASQESHMQCAGNPGAQLLPREETAGWRKESSCSESDASRVLYDEDACESKHRAECTSRCEITKESKNGNSNEAFDTLHSYPDLAKHSALDRNCSSQNEQKYKGPDQKARRTHSFVDGKAPRSGLVALARGIERRFKKKRRSKTTDFSGLWHNVASNEVNPAPSGDVPPGDACP